MSPAARGLHTNKEAFILGNVTSSISAKRAGEERTEDLGLPALGSPAGSPVC